MEGGTCRPESLARNHDILTRHIQVIYVASDRLLEDLPLGNSFVLVVVDSVTDIIIPSFAGIDTARVGGPAGQIDIYCLAPEFNEAALILRNGHIVGAFECQPFFLPVGTYFSPGIFEVLVGIGNIHPRIIGLL